MFSISTNVMSRNTHRVSLGYLWLDQRSHASRFLSLKKKLSYFASLAVVAYQNCSLQTKMIREQI